MNRQELVNAIAGLMHRIAPTAEVILYGSTARGDARPDSDIDLLILLDQSELTPEQEMNLTRPLYELEVQTNISISPMVMLRKLWVNRPFQTPFYLHVMNEGITL